MKTRFLAIALALAALACALPMGAAHAQATRTWVSGVGDDANPCSRTAPCKTFAGAISKTAAGGIINCLDPGGFGAVTITKAMSIKCVSVSQSSDLATGTYGVVVNAGVNDVVTLEDLAIEGSTGSGLIGIRFLQGAALHLRHVTIQQFQAAAPSYGYAVLFAPTNAASQLTITNSEFRDNATGAVLIQPGASATTVHVAMKDVTMYNNGFGVKVDLKANSSPAAVTGAVTDSVIGGGGTAGPGVNLVTQGTGSADISFDRMTIANSAEGVAAKGSASMIARVTNSTLTGNSSAFSQNSGGLVYTYGTNQIDGNPAGSSTAGTLH